MVFTDNRTVEENGGLSYRRLAAALFLVSLATLMLEILDSRVLSVLTWYHLAFFAVSLAMLGMAGGAIWVLIAGERYIAHRPEGAIANACIGFAVATPLTHLLSLVMPIPALDLFSPMELATIVLATLALAAPFFFAGVAVALALTRSGGPVGRLYAADLIGAATGCVLVVPLLEWTNMTAVISLAAAAAAAAAFVLLQPSRSPRRWLALTLAGVLIAGAGWTGRSDAPITVLYAKNRKFRPARLATAAPLAPREFVVDWSAWNTFSFLSVLTPNRGLPHYWGPGRGAEQFRATKSHPDRCGRRDTAHRMER
jgi:hypothetical protein